VEAPGINALCRGEEKKEIHLAMNPVTEQDPQGVTYGETKL